MFKAVLLVFQAFKLFQVFVFVLFFFCDGDVSRLPPIFLYKHRHIESGWKSQYGPDYKVPEGTQSLNHQTNSRKKKLSLQIRGDRMVGGL